MRKTINVWILVATLAVILIVYFILSNSVNKALLEVQEQHATMSQLDAQREEENLQLQEDVAYSTTDPFIENVARTEYGYIFENETQLIFDNPEALYGEENMPSP